MLAAGASLASAPGPAIVTAMKVQLVKLLILLAAASSVTGATHQADTSGIAWFKGELTEAFAAARSTHKPILLYWGASWCPPCQQLQSTVFSRADFIGKSRAFVAVYLDGDDSGAQKWGEEFKVVGYPTLLVLDADRRELMRIASSMDLGLYATVLDTALADLQPAGELLVAATQGRALDIGQCRRLAYNGWVLDDLQAAEQAPRAQQLIAAAAHCPGSARVERARLLIDAASLLGQAEGEALKAGGSPSASLRVQVALIGAILGDKRLALTVADALQYLDEGFFRAVKADRGASDWVRRFIGVMDAAAVDPDFAEADQLGAVASKLIAIKTIEGSIPAGAARAARARVDAAMAGKQIPYIRSGLINATLGVFDALGQNEQAYQVVQAELGHTATPYYYEADLGELAEGLGRTSEALQWYARSYRDSRGAATRFQWGVRYVVGILKLTPEDGGRIRTVTAEVLGELDGPDRIYRRARMRLERLDRALRDWNESSKGAHRDVLAALRNRLQELCVKIPAREPAHASCDAFLAGT